MLHAGLDLVRKRLDVCLLSDQGELVDELTAFPDAGGLKALAQRVEAHDEPVRRGDRVDDRRPLRPRHPRALTAGRSRSPTPRRSRAWRRWR